MIDGKFKILVTESIDQHDLSFDFNKTLENEQEIYEQVMESGASQIVHFAAPDGYYADLHITDKYAVLLVTEKVYNDTGFQDLLFNLEEFGLCCITTRDFGYNIGIYKNR